MDRRPWLMKGEAMTLPFDLKLVSDLEEQDATAVVPETGEEL
jgi:hypothetical protein